MEKFRYYKFICLLIFGGILFFGYEGMADQFQEQMQEAWMEPMGESVSDNDVFKYQVFGDEEPGVVSANDMENEGNRNVSGNTLNGNDETDDLRQWSYIAVDESYFDDAVFIGDSRTVGLYDYAGLDRATFYASSGLTVYKLFEEPDGKYKDGNWPENIETALENRQFGKVYLMIGINEMGTGDVDYFMKHYEAAVARIRELQPDAVIYLESILRVTSERSEQGDYINNQGIDERNQRIAGLADDQTIFYLDVNSVVCDETGGLNPEYTFDGVHLYAQYIHIWKEYLMEHAVSFEN